MLSSDMSHDSQWKTFQPPIMNSDPAILEYKSLPISTPKVISESHQNNYRNDTDYGGEFMDSLSSNGKNLSSYNVFPITQSSPRNGSARFPIGTFTGLEGGLNFAESVMNSTYQDQPVNQGTRETGIIEKLLVI